MKKIFGFLSAIFSINLSSQPIVQSFAIVEDSVEINILHLHKNGGMYPMDTQCMIFDIKTTYTGVVIVEILGVCKNKMANFRAYCHNGTIYSCVSAPAIHLDSIGINVNNINTKYVRIRKDVRW